MIPAGKLWTPPIQWLGTVRKNGQ